MAEQLVPHSNIEIIVPPQLSQRLNEDLTLLICIYNLGRDPVCNGSRVIISKAGIFAQALSLITSPIAPGDRAEHHITVPLSKKFPEGPRQESITGLVGQLPIVIVDPNDRTYKCERKYIDIEMSYFANSFLGYSFSFSDNPKSPFSNWYRANCGFFGLMGVGKTSEITQLLRIVLPGIVCGQQNSGEVSQTKRYFAPSLHGYSSTIEEPQWNLFDCFGFLDDSIVFLTEFFPRAVKGLLPKDFCDKDNVKSLLKAHSKHVKKSLERKGKASEYALHCCVFVLAPGAFVMENYMRSFRALVEKTSEFGITPMLIVTHLDDHIGGFTGDFDSMNDEQLQCWESIRNKFSQALGVLPENIMGVANTTIEQSFGQQKNHALILWKILKNADNYIRFQNASFAHEEKHDMSMSKIEEDCAEEVKPLAYHWTIAQVAEWLGRNGLGYLRETFQQQEIDGKTLLLLTHEDLQAELGVRRFADRKFILHEVRKLHQQY